MKKFYETLENKKIDIKALFEQDHEFLFQGKVFPPNFVDTWVTYKMEKEYNAVRYRPHPYEMRLYYDV